MNKQPNTEKRIAELEEELDYRKKDSELLLNKVSQALDGDMIHVELYKEDDAYRVCISTDSSSGATYPVESIKDIGDRIRDFIEIYLL